MLKKIETLFKSKDKYQSDDNKLLKTKIYEDVMKMEPEVLTLLLSDESIKKEFFTEVQGILIFDKQKFSWFLESKEFLPDSYTSYKNKIGLMDKQGHFISSSNDVVLSFPYKDCILTGGQDKDEQKRQEIMFNEIIASDEITRMLAPKVFTNAKRYTKDGIEKNIIFDENDNLIIKGNNLIALACILKRYERKVKCIYIDPPYNTRSDSFNYNDNFNHSTWLTFMKNRLEIAKKLLREDGLIFVQCDDKEQAYLKVLMDEVFDRENFVNNLVIKMSDASGKKMAHIKTKFPKIKEYILLYKKNNIVLNPIREAKGEIDNEYKIFFDVSDEIINKIHNNTIIKEEYLKIRNILLENMITFKDAIQKYKISPQKELEFFEKNLNKIARTSNASGIKKYIETINVLDKIDIVNYNGNCIIVKTDYDKTSTDPRVQFVFAKDTYYSALCDLWLNISTSINSEGGITFKNAKKPEKLLSQIIKCSTEPDDIVLDFYLGSGTTAAIAHKMGRKYIGIEQMDYIENITIERLKKVIDGEQSGISKVVEWHGGGSFVYCELKENSYLLVDEILNATEETIDNIKEKIYKDNRIIPYLTHEEIASANVMFESLEINDKKKALISLIDKNKLYVNYEDIEDEMYNITDEEKRFTESFYEEI